MLDAANAYAVHKESEAISDLGNANIMTLFTHHLQI